MPDKKKLKRVVGEREIMGKEAILEAARQHGMDADRFSEMSEKDLELGYSALLAGIRRLLVEDKPVQLHRIGVLVPGKRKELTTIHLLPEMALLQEISRVRIIEDDEIRFKGHVWGYATFDEQGNELARWDEARRESPYGTTGWYWTAFDILTAQPEVAKVVGYLYRGESEPFLTLDRTEVEEDDPEEEA